VDKNVYSRTGKNLVIPKGSRLIGRYRSNVQRGQSRVFIIWSRLERPDGVIVDIGSPGVSPIGIAGLGGDVDNHYLEIYGASVLLSTLGPFISLLAGDNESASSEEREIINGSQSSFNETAEIALENSIDIPPTIHVAQGTEISIFVNRDLSFADVPSVDVR